MPAPTIYNENELPSLIAQGNESAFDHFYQTYFEEVKTFVAWLVKSEMLAEDLAQEIFLILWDKRVALTEVHSLRAYLFIIARNHALNALKRAASLTEVKAALSHAYAHQTPDPAADFILKDYMEYLQEQIDALSPKAREVFRLCRQEHRSYDEVAAMLGVTRDAVKKHMVASMKTLKMAVEKDLGIPLTVLLLALHQQG